MRGGHPNWSGRGNVNDSRGPRGGPGPHQECKTAPKQPQNSRRSLQDALKPLQAIPATKPNRGGVCIITSVYTERLARIASLGSLGARLHCRDRVRNRIRVHVRSLASLRSALWAPIVYSPLSVTAQKVVTRRALDRRNAITVYVTRILQ